MQKLTKKEEKLIVIALEFFTGFRWRSPAKYNKKYVKILENESHEDFEELTEKLGGKLEWSKVIRKKS